MRRASLISCVLFLSCLGTGCGDGSTGAGDPPVDLGADQSPAGPPDLAPILDPRRFDCSSLGPDGKGRPERQSPIPVACALDPSCRRPQVAGHRGAGGMLGALAPEDTLAAYRAAIALGIEFAETDPRQTADGVLVNLHDPTVERTTDGRGAVSSLTLQQIQALRIKAEGFAGDFACERVPTLLEVLRSCRGRIVVLVDANKTDRVDLLVQAILDAEALDWAIFDTSSVDKIDRALKIEPSLRFQIRPSSVAEIAPQLDHFAPRLPVIVELERTDWVQGAALVHTRGSRAFSNVFVEDLIAMDGGDLSGYGKALDAGLDILQTDRPDRVLALLRQRGLR